MAEQPIRERTVEQYLNKQIQSLGGLSFKFKSTVNGVPDRIIIFDGKTHFIEVKRPGGKLRKEQVAMHNRMRNHRASVHVVSSHADIDKFIRNILHEEPLTDKEVKSYNQPKETTILSSDSFKI